MSNTLIGSRTLIWMLAIAMAPWAVADDRPNIVFIMSDDHTSQAVGAYGSRLAYLDPTPNL
ncbi:MAG: acetylglucosamine-6-sulfatase, partial [Rhodopirellula bahusiensis]